MSVAEIVAQLTPQAEWALRTQACEYYEAPGWLEGAVVGVTQAHELGLIDKTPGGTYYMTDLGSAVYAALPRRSATTPDTKDA